MVFVALALVLVLALALAAATATFFVWLGSRATPCALRPAGTWLGIRVTT